MGKKQQHQKKPHQKPAEEIKKQQESEESSTPFWSEEEVRRKPSPRRPLSPVPHSTLSAGRAKGIGLFCVGCCCVLVIVCLLLAGRWLRLRSAELLNPMRRKVT